MVHKSIDHEKNSVDLFFIIKKIASKQDFQLEGFQVRWMKNNSS